MSYNVNTRLTVIRGAHKESVGRVLHLPNTDRPAGLPADFIALGFDSTAILYDGCKERKVKGDDLHVLWFAPGQLQADVTPAPPIHPVYTEADFERQQEEIATQRAAKNQEEMDAYNAASEADTQARFPKGGFVRVREGDDYNGSVGQVVGYQNGHILVQCAPWSKSGHRLIKSGRELKGGWNGHTIEMSECHLEPSTPYVSEL